MVEGTRAALGKDEVSTIASCHVICHVGRVYNVRNMIASPIHRLAAMPDVDVANLLVVVDSGRHLGYLAMSNQWQMQRMHHVVRKEEQGRHALVPAIHAWRSAAVHNAAGPSLSMLFEKVASGHGRAVDKKLLN